MKVIRITTPAEMRQLLNRKIVPPMTLPVDTQTDRQIKFRRPGAIKRSLRFLWLFGCAAQQLGESWTFGRECFSDVSNGS